MSGNRRIPAGLLRRLLRVVSPMVLSPQVPLSMQRRLLDMGGRIPLPPGVRITPLQIDGVAGERVIPVGARGAGVVLYLHGGGYVLGSARTHRGLAARLAARMGVEVYVPDYRLAPEHPHPAALEDALRVYRGLLDQGINPGRVAVAGDSAGGGLALAMCLALRDGGQPLPAVLGMLCPWLDLAPDLDGSRVPSDRDPLLTPAALRSWATAYVGAEDPAQPSISPLHGELSGLPLIVLHDAGDDPLRVDAERFVGRAESAGLRVARHHHAGLWHGFHAHAGILAAADDALRSFADGLTDRLALPLTGTRVGIVGAGMSGLCMAARMREAGLDDFTVYEKAGEVGGTWRENRYPGLSCDVPSRLYSYSFAPNPDWTHAFAPGPEILGYFTRVSDELGLRDHIRFNTEVVHAEWDGERWKLELSDGSSDAVDVLVSATGVLHHPKLPDIEGLESFAGAMFHSARWDPSVALDGRRVAVVGTGSTGVQITTALARKTSQLLLFQRTAQWVLPVPNVKYRPLTRLAFRSLPWLNRLAYRLRQQQLEWILGAAVLRPGWQRSLVSGLCRLNLRFAVRDVDLRRRLTPDYVPMCKRLVMSSGFYPAMQAPGVELITERIVRVEPRGVVTADGRLHEVDVLVLATGFDAHAFMRPMSLTGQDGVTLEDAWAERPHAYRTVALPDFPNFFMLMGPHSPFGNQSLIAVAEAQAGYVMWWVERLRRGELRSARPTQEATSRFNERMGEATPGTVWSTGCRSWYLGPDGLPQLWPWSPAEHRRMLREPDLAEFVVERHPTPSAIAN